MKELTESLEKYLLAIYELSQTCDAIIVKDVSEYLKIGGASTSEAIKTLRDKGFVNYVPYGTVSLTDVGEKVAEEKIYRHNTITNFLNKVLNIEIENAETNASAIEYSMTENVLTKFVHFLNFMEKCTCKEPRWMKSCKKMLSSGVVSEKCSACMTGDETCDGCCDGCGQSSINQ